MEENLLKALNEIYELTKDSEVDISVMDLLNKHKVKYKNRVSEIIKAENIILVKRNKNKVASIKWNSVIPNIKMVDDINKKCIELNRLGNKKQKEKNQKRYKKEIKIFGFTIYSTITTEL